MLTCLICTKEYRDLGTHVRRTHHLTGEEYLSKFPGATLVDEELVRERTSKRDHAAATAKTLETFSTRYEGGHPLKDPRIREQQKFTRLVSGDHSGAEKARKTNMERYGVEHLSQTEERREISRKLMQKISANRPAAVCPDPEKFKEQVLAGTPLYKLAEMYGFKSQWVIKHWIEAMGLPKGGAYRERNKLS